MRYRQHTFRNVTQDTIFTPETAQAKAEAAVWLMRLMETPIILDDNFFAFLGWCAGGLKPFARCLQADVVLLSGRKAEVLRAKKAVTGLSDISEKRLDDALEEIFEEHPILHDTIRRAIVQILHTISSDACTHKVLSTGSLRHIKKFFGLCDEAVCLCTLAFMAGAYQAAENYFEDSLRIQDYGNRHLLAHMLGIQASRCRELITQMTGMGILDMSTRQIRLCDSVNEAWQNGDQHSLQKTFCQPVQGSVLPLEQFHIPAEDREHIVRLLRPSRLARTRPVHILLYGAPGTGKTSFVRSLAASLSVKAWAVPCKDDDSSQDRRAALTACLRMASRHKGAFVLVDEAERLLDTAVSFDRSSSTKAWLNDFLERKNQRVIWISNEVDHIDPAVRRRFSYSLHFEELSRRERRVMWESIAQHHKVGTRLSSGQLAVFAEHYPVQAAVMENAVRQAKTVATSKTFAACVERVLKAHITLNCNGRRPRHDTKHTDGYSLGGVCTEQPLDTLLTQCRRLDTMMCENTPLKPGMGTMLFYGPPGTGKTALARHIAHMVDRECTVLRASDLLSPFVGVAEQNIAAAFAKAEDARAVLVIDEADSFLYSREGAQRSWEQTLVNEFLTALETCRCLCICTTNRREGMDSAAMRRFSFKVPFAYAGAVQIAALYTSLLEPLVGHAPTKDMLDSLCRQTRLAPGDFHAVRMQFALAEVGTVGHESLIAALLREQSMKLESSGKSIGFM